MRLGYIWLAGVRIGLASVRKEPVLGVKRLLLPASYWRSVEFRYVWETLRAHSPAGLRLLDLGSPKDLAVMLARQAGHEVVATDILPEAVETCRRYAAALGISGTGRGRVHAETQDGRHLSYADNSFDAAFSVSVLEHIPDGGDTEAIKELLRVVKPGGIVVITVPYDLSYRETFVAGDVYERSAEEGENLFFERHYDAEELQRRLLTHGDASAGGLELWGERFLRMERLLSRLGVLRVPLSPFETAFAAGFLSATSRNGGVRPMAAFFTLRKAVS